jgi:hypothetical protein
MLYSKELREWASLIQSNVATAAALKVRATQNTVGGGSVIRGLMFEVSGGQTPSLPETPTNQITEKLWDDVDKKAAKMKVALPYVMDVEAESLPDAPADEDGDIVF